MMWCLRSLHTLVFDFLDDLAVDILRDSAVRSIDLHHLPWYFAFASPWKNQSDNLRLGKDF